MQCDHPVSTHRYTSWMSSASLVGVYGRTSSPISSSYICLQSQVLRENGISGLYRGVIALCTSHAIIKLEPSLSILILGLVPTILRNGGSVGLRFAVLILLDFWYKPYTCALTFPHTRRRIDAQGHTVVIDDDLFPTILSSASALVEYFKTVRFVTTISKVTTSVQLYDIFAEKLVSIGTHISHLFIQLVPSDYKNTLSTILKNQMDPRGLGILLSAELGTIM